MAGSSQEEEETETEIERGLSEVSDASEENGPESTQGGESSGQGGKVGTPTEAAAVSEGSPSLGAAEDLVPAVPEAPTPEVASSEEPVVPAEAPAPEAVPVPPPEPPAPSEAPTPVDSVATAPADAGIPAAQPAAPVPAAPRWYVLRVQAGKENSVKKNLEKKARTEKIVDRIEKVLVPSELVSELHGREKRVVERKLYPGYIMIKMVADEETVYHVRSTQGVGDFVGGSGTIPDPLPDHEVERILGVVEKGSEEPKLDIKFKKGQSVTIKNGPFQNLNGVVDDVSQTKGTIRVIVTIFGRATPIELQYWEVESV